MISIYWLAQFRWSINWSAWTTKWFYRYISKVNWKRKLFGAIKHPLTAAHFRLLAFTSNWSAFLLAERCRCKCRATAIESYSNLARTFTHTHTHKSVNANYLQRKQIKCYNLERRTNKIRIFSKAKNTQSRTMYFFPLYLSESNIRTDKKSNRKSIRRCSMNFLII